MIVLFYFKLKWMNKIIYVKKRWTGIHTTVEGIKDRINVYFYHDL